MRRAVIGGLVVAAVLAPAAAASPQTGFAFGRTGGNIRPFTVTIGTDGSVRVTGAATVGRTQVTRLELGDLNRFAVTTRFGSLPARTECKGSLPDVATTFIRVGARVVRVHGGCVPAYQRLWKALASAVLLTR